MHVSFSNLNDIEVQVLYIIFYLYFIYYLLYLIYYILLNIISHRVYISILLQYYSQFAISILCFVKSS